MIAYIKKSVRGSYLELEDDLRKLPGYENAVGEVWEDYDERRKYLILSDEQLQFKADHPEATVKQVWDMNIPVPPTPPVPERTLKIAKAERIQALYLYDSSEAINQFFLENAAMWLDKNTRAGLRLRFEAEQSSGKTVTTLWYGITSYTIKVEDALAMLLAIELYASECYDNTQNHAASIESLDTIEAVDSYDFTTGYPEKLTFEYMV